MEIDTISGANHKAIIIYIVVWHIKEIQSVYWFNQFKPELIFMEGISELCVVLKNESQPQTLSQEQLSTLNHPSLNKQQRTIIRLCRFMFGINAVQQHQEIWVNTNVVKPHIKTRQHICQKQLRVSTSNFYILLIWTFIKMSTYNIGFHYQRHKWKRLLQLYFKQMSGQQSLSCTIMYIQWNLIHPYFLNTLISGLYAHDLTTIRQR